MNDVIWGLMVPLIGTSVGAAAVFFLRREIDPTLQRALAGFAAGVMVAASVWSLLLPAIEQSAALERWAFVPAAGGFWVGMLFLMLLERATALPARAEEGGRGTGLMLLAVTLHNIPEGMAVGAVYAGLRSGVAGVTAVCAMSLALGIALQNLPEGAIISLPLRAGGASRTRAFWGGVLSGAVEPLSAAAMLALAGLLTPLMPWFLSFAAGAMLYVVVVDLVPEMSDPSPACTGTLMFAAGFALMMALDVALG